MSWLTRALNILRPNRVSRDVQRELSFHVAERADELELSGMSRSEAEREAARRFGHQSTMHENTRDADMLTWLESFAGDVRQSARSLKASPAFTIVAVLSLALGIGANTAIFSLINAVMVRSLPVEHPEQLVTISNKGIGSDFNFLLWEALRDSKSGLAGATAYSNTDFNLANGGEARRVRGTWVSGGYFSTLGVQPSAGRLIANADDTRGCAPIAVLGHGFWQSDYGAANDAIGKNISLNGKSFTIVGVAREGFFGAEVGRNVQVYAPLCANDGIANADMDRLHHMWFLSVIGRLAPESSAAQVENNLRQATAAIFERGVAADEYPDVLKNLPGHHFTVSEGVSSLSSLRQSYSKALWVLMTIVGIVLIIGCANVANLLLARSAAREREIAVRFALGASRIRVVRQLLTETMLLTSLGALAGLVFAKWSSKLLVQLLSSGRSAVGLEVPLDARVLAFTMGVATITGLLFGLAPAWRATRTNPQEAMRANGRSIASGHSRFSTGKALVIGQVALSLMLVVGGGLLLGTFSRLSNINTGFNSENVLLVSVGMSNANLGEARLRQMPAEMLGRIRELNGVESASASDLVPISGMAWNGRFHVPGYEPKSPKDNLVYFNAVSDDFFKTLGTRVLAGRAFTAADRTGAQKVAIINLSTARKFFNSDNPVGRQFYLPEPRGKDNGPAVEIVGIVEDTKYTNLREASRTIAYLPMTENGDVSNSLNIEIRSSANLQPLISQVSAVMSQISPRISLEYKRFDDQVAASLSRERVLATLAGFFGGLALLLAMIGLYGTMSYGVSRRRNEIGIRIALGAERPRVLRMVMGEVARMLFIGLGVGLAGAFATSKYVASFLYGVEANDTMTMVLSTALLATVALLAGAIPAWRAARLDPMFALREE